MRCARGTAYFDTTEFSARLDAVARGSEGRFVVRWHGDTLTSYKRVPLWEMICSIYPKQCDAAVTRHPAEEFAGQDCICRRQRGRKL